MTRSHKSLTARIFLPLALTALLMVYPSTPANAQGTTTTVAVPGDTAPGGNGGAFTSFGPAGFNNTDQIKFGGSIDTNGNGSSDEAGLFISSSGLLSAVARKDDAAPGGNGGTFITFFFNSYVLNNTGQTAFKAFVDTDGDGLTNENGLFHSSSGSLSAIAREGDTAPGGNGGAFTILDDFAFNNSSQAAAVDCGYREIIEDSGASRGGVAFSGDGG